MSFHERFRGEIEEFIAVCRRLDRNRYVTGHGGNLAWRLEEDLILITPTKRSKGLMEAADLIFVDSGGNVVEGSLPPTGELPMYLTFFAGRPDIVSVIHCHPPYANAFAITGGKNWLMRPMFPETATEVGPVPVIPYAEPASQALADSFLPYLDRYNSFIMENHGVVVMTGEGIRKTLETTEVLEVTAQSLLAALSAGPVKEISRDQVAKLGCMMRERGLPLFGAPGIYESLEELYYG